MPRRVWDAHRFVVVGGPVSEVGSRIRHSVKSKLNGMRNGCDIVGAPAGRVPGGPRAVLPEVTPALDPASKGLHVRSWRCVDPGWASGGC